MTKQVVPQLPAANDYVALARTRLRDLTGSDAIVGPAAATPGAAEQSDGEKAAALLKAASHAGWWETAVCPGRGPRPSGLRGPPEGSGRS